MTRGVFHSATTANGVRLDYRTNPLVTIVRAVHSWLYLPRLIHDWANRRGVQRRIDGGPWLTIGGAP